MIDREYVENAIKRAYGGFVEKFSPQFPELTTITPKVSWTGDMAAHAPVGDVQIRFSDRLVDSNVGHVQHEWDLDFDSRMSYNGVLWRHPSLRGWSVGVALVDVRERLASVLGIQEIVIGISETPKSSQFWRGQGYRDASDAQIARFRSAGVSVDEDRDVLYKLL